MSQRTPTRSSPRDTVSLSSPSGASRRFVDALHLNSIFSASPKQDVSGIRSNILGGRSSQRQRRPHQLAPHAPQRDLVQAIVDDPEQWEKLHRALKQQRRCTSMGITQDLHGLIQDRIQDMEMQDAYLSSDSSSRSPSPTSSMDC